MIGAYPFAALYSTVWWWWKHLKETSCTIWWQLRAKRSAVKTEPEPVSMEKALFLQYKLYVSMERSRVIASEARWSTETW